MSLRIESQAEPIAGYRLIERLGGGGFGEVWKAEAPGGIFKAIKFVYGNLQSGDDDDNARAQQEFKALKRVQSVRHPFILSLERYDKIDDQLVIVMELADRTLWDRFVECRKSGHEGIPRAELIAYIRDTAEALDFMNSEYQLQHLDIKPQNLFLVHNHVKVADFGLVKDLEGVAATVTGGVTPVYAAPETFDGWISRFSDQYSLAIVYQELLTGKRPFAGTTMRQLVMQHLQAKPDLSSLPAADRAAMARALAKNPDERFPTCTQFISTLDRPTIASIPVSAPESPALADSQAIAADAHADTPVDLSEAEVVEPSLSLDDADENQKTLSAKPPGAAANAAPRRRPPKAEQDSSILTVGAGEIVPAVIIGLGHLGLGVLKQFRRDLIDRFGGSGVLPHVRLLYIDTDSGAVPAAIDNSTSSALLQSEVLHVKLRRPSHFLKMRDTNSLESWLDWKLLFQIPRQQTHAGMRALGRLAFVDNFRAISGRIEADLKECSAPDTLHQACKLTELELRSSKPRVYIVTGLAGGTGGGMFLDLAYVLRGLLKNQGAPAEVTGLFVLPSPTTSKPALANTFAALTELNHFNDANAMFSARYEMGATKGGDTVSELGPAFQRCLLIPGPDKNDDDRCLTRAAGLLHAELFSPQGCTADEIRGGTAPTSARRHRGYQTFRTYRVAWPRRMMLHQAANKLCQRLVEHWLAKPRKQPPEEIAQSALDKWEQLRFRPENLIERLKQKAKELLKRDPEQMLADVIAPVKAALEQANKQRSDTNFSLLPVVQALAGLERLLGVPSEDDDDVDMSEGESEGEGESAIIAKAIQAASDALAAECDQTLAELVVGLIEDPKFRLAGAEEFIRRFTTCVQQALESYEELYTEVRERSFKIYQRLELLAEERTTPHSPSQTPSWRTAFTRKTNSNKVQLAGELLDLFDVYLKCQFQSLVLRQISRIYTSLRGHLSDEVREIGFCRTRLTELLDLIKGERASPEEIKQSTRVADKCLLPRGCVDATDALERFEKEILADDVQRFDHAAQVMIRQQFRALVNLCLSSSSMVKSLAPQLLTLAETFLNSRLQTIDVAEMYLSQQSELDDEKLAEELRQMYKSAAPEYGRTTCHSQIALVVLPNTKAGARLAELFEYAIPKIRIAFSSRVDEITLYREFCDLALADLDQLFQAAQDAYREGGERDPSSLHSRTDITEWRMVSSGR